MKPLTPATQLHAKPSANFADKLAATQAQLKAAAAELQPLKQASSLGAEDVVITHLINHLALDIPVFVLETGAHHSETLQGQKAWITGLRREQSQARAEVSAQEADVTNGVAITKLNPLVDWTWGDVWHYIALNKVDYNPLHDQFFPSIGCAPCTRAISLGEDFRAGRWWWEDETAKECGLHVKV